MNEKDREIINKKEELRPIGTQFNVTIDASSTGSTDPRGKIITYEIVAHSLVAPSGEFGPLLWAEEIKAINIDYTDPPKYIKFGKLT